MFSMALIKNTRSIVKTRKKPPETRLAHKISLENY